MMGNLIKYSNFQTTLLIGLVLFFSCRKEKLNEDYEKVLVGEWNWGGTNLICLSIKENGDVIMKGVQGELLADARIVKLDRIMGTSYDNATAPQVAYYYSVKYKKRKWGSKFETLHKYPYIAYVNGGYDAGGNFVYGDLLILKNGQGYGDLMYAK